MRNPSTIPEAPPQIALPWIIRLRYGMALGQITTAVVVHVLLNIDLPLFWIALGPALIAASNVFLQKRAAEVSPPQSVSTSTLVALAFLLDTLCLTGVLMLTGGPTNPFTLLYLVNITLSATILTKRQTWLLGALSILCFGLLFWIYRPIAALEMHQHMQGTNLHLTGMWVGFVVATFLVAVFAGKISELLREREESLLRVQEELAKKDRLASLATLAAGAAHELNTPLGTIAVVAKELERYATSHAHDAAVAEDSRLIRTEVDRCREILWRMSVSGAQPAALETERISVQDLISGVVAEFATAGQLHVEFRGALPPLRIPRRSVEQALIALIRNAFEASDPNAGVYLGISSRAGIVRFDVRDHGKGMTPETLRRICEPFHTTKAPGKGMGLGTFLARILAEQLGGSLTYESAQNRGTTATFELPAADASQRIYAHE
ncbi:MAG: ATP-binding protein [Bryobacteraceae bacterium]